MRRVYFLGAFLGLFVSAPALAQQTEEPIENCGNLPYSVQTSNAGGEIQARVTADALTGLLSRFREGSGATIGAEYMAAAVSSSGAEAYARVIEHYRCISRNRIVRQVNAGSMSADHLQAFDDRVAVLTELITNAQNAALVEETKTAAVRAVIGLTSAERQRIREALATPLDPAIRAQVTAAMSAISPLFFTRLNSTVGWARLDTPFASIGGCGGVIKRVLEQTSGNMQAALSTTPSLFSAFFQQSPTNAVTQSGSMLSNYAGLIRSAPTGADIPSLTPAFRSCTSDLLRRVDPQAAAAIDAAGAPSTSGTTTDTPQADQPAPGAGEATPPAGNPPPPGNAPAPAPRGEEPQP